MTAIAALREFGTDGADWDPFNHRLIMRARDPGERPRRQVLPPAGLRAESDSSDCSLTRDDGRAVSSPEKLVRTPPSPASLLQSPFAALLQSPFDRAVRALNAIDHLNQLGIAVVAPRPRRLNNRACWARDHVDAETLLVIAHLIAGQLRTTEQTKVVRAMCAQNRRNSLLGKIQRTAIHKRLHAAARSQGFTSFGEFLRVMAAHEVANAPVMSRATHVRPVIEPGKARAAGARDRARRRRARGGKAAWRP
jgi:hypothetical protein